MRLRLSLITVVVVLLVAWLALTRHRANGANAFVLQVPATHMSVGQQFQPRVVSLAQTAHAVTDTIELSLWDGQGRRLAGESVSLAPAAITSGNPMSLPRPGAFELRARFQQTTQTIRLQAMPDAAPGLGGVLPVAALGLAPGVMDFLRDHSFAVVPANTTAPMPPVTRLLLVGRPELEGGDLTAQYTWLWRQVADGATVLLLEPPAPSLASYWPLAPPLIAPARGDACGPDAFAPPLTDGLAADDGLRSLLRPSLTFDLGGESLVPLYHWDGRLLLPPSAQHNHGYAGCHPLVTYRLGSGWVSASMLPLLQHFQDARARLYLMNLIMAAARRKRHAPASPGLAWVMRQRMKTLEHDPAPQAAVVYYRTPPQAVESAPELVPAAADGNPRTCWTVPATRTPGASLTLRFPLPRPAHALIVGADALPAYRLEASPDGRQWTPLSSAASAAPLSVPLPAGSWQAFRLTLTAPSAPWRLCRFSAQ